MTCPPVISEQLLSVAIAAARAAGAVQQAHAGDALKVNDRRRHDLKLEVDRLAEQAVVEAIHAVFPGHAILAEEGGEYGGAGEYIWIVDPLDGTVNYFQGLPYYCASVACYHKAASSPAAAARSLARLGEPVVGVVYAPPVEELFVAERGRGATRNGQPIRVSAVTTLAEAVVATGFGSQEDYIQRMNAVMQALLRKVRKLRCLGAAAYDLANLACGRLTGFYERGLRTWDIAAGRLILEEAGGRMTASEIAPGAWDVLASASGIHEELKRELGME